jgi:prophage regulatory protein
MKNLPTKSECLLKLEQVKTLTGLSTSTVYKSIQSGLFPAPVHLDLGDRKRPPSRWVAGEVSNWIVQQITNRNEAGIFKGDEPVATRSSAGIGW